MMDFNVVVTHKSNFVVPVKEMGLGRVQTNSLFKCKNQHDMKNPQNVVVLSIYIVFNLHDIVKA